MPTCGVCHISYSNIKDLMTHLKHVHNLGENSKYNCNELNCYRNFPSLNSYRKHLKSHKNVHVVVQTSNTCGNTSGSHEELVNDNFEDDLDILNTECGSKTHDLNTTFFDDFKNNLSQNVLIFIHAFYADSSLSRKDVQIIIDAIHDLISEPLDIFKNYLEVLVSKYNMDRSHRDNLNKFIDQIQNMFTGLHTEYLRFKYLEKSNHYINPVECILGQRLDKMENGLASPQTYTYQFIPLRLVFKNFLEMPNVLPFFLYYDDYESGNPLSSHAGIHKLGAVYSSIPCMPVRFQSSLENIFLTLLFHTMDLKEFGSSAIFNKLVEECNYLQKSGIEVVSSGKKIKVYFVLTLLLGDNLGLNKLLGFTESFRSNHYCRFCKCARVDMEHQVNEDQTMLRNRTNYAADIQLNNLKVTGIKELCVWNKVQLFHVCENYSVDILHTTYSKGLLFLI
uniref:C2H2-type domain-containing protein n=1 Tax=Photinus pyralis TaxID=7054 RepID=A0A1Y1N0F2_PHOPY